MTRSLTRFLPGSLFWTLAALVGVWQVWVWLSHVDALVAPSPAAVVLDLVQHPEVYVSSVAATLLVALLGLAGTSTGWSIALPHVVAAVAGACLMDLLIAHFDGRRLGWPSSGQRRAILPCARLSFIITGLLRQRHDTPV